MEQATQPTPDRAEATRVRPNGPVAAVLLASGIGAFVIGLLTTLAAGSESFAESIQYDDGVGPLSGKTLWASAAFFVSWGALAYLFRDKELSWKPLLITAAVLIGLGVLGTFPIFFQAFAPE